MLVKYVSVKDNSAKEWLLRSSEKLVSSMLSVFPAKSLRTVLATLAIYGAVIGCKSELPVQLDGASQVYDTGSVYNGQTNLITGQGFPMWAQSILGTMGDIRADFHATDNSVLSIPFNYTYGLAYDRYALRLSLSATSAATIQIQLQDNLGNYLTPVSLNVTPAQTTYYIYGAQFESHNGIKTVSALMPAGSNSLVVYQADLVTLNAAPTFELGVPINYTAPNNQLLAIPVNWDLTAVNLQRTFATVDIRNIGSVANQLMLQLKVAGQSVYRQISALPVTNATNRLVFPLEAVGAAQYDSVQLVSKQTGAVVDTLAISQVALASTSASFGIKTQFEFNEVTGSPATPQVMNIPFVYDLTALGLSTDKLMFEIDLQRMSGTMTAVQVQFIDSNGNYHTGPIVPVTGALTTARILASDIKSDITNIQSIQLTAVSQVGQLQAAARVKHLTTAANSFMQLPVPTSTSFKTTFQPVGLSATLVSSDKIAIDIKGGAFQAYVWVNGVRSGVAPLYLPKSFNGDGNDFAFIHTSEFQTPPTGAAVTSIMLEIVNPGAAKNLELRTVNHTNIGGTVKEKIYEGRSTNAYVKGTGNSNRIFTQDVSNPIVYPVNQSGSGAFGIVYGSSLASLTNLAVAANTFNNNLFGNGLYTTSTFGSNLMTNNFSSGTASDLDRDGIRLVYTGTGTELTNADINASVVSSVPVANGGKNKNSIGSFFSAVFNTGGTQVGGAVTTTQYYGNNPTTLQGSVTQTDGITTGKTLQTIDGYISQTRLDVSNNPIGSLTPVIINSDTVTLDDTTQNILLVSNGNLRLQATGQNNLIAGDGNRVFGVMPIGRKLKIANDPNYPPVNSVAYSEAPWDMAVKNNTQLSFNLKTSGSIDIKVSAVVGSNGNYQTISLGTISGATYNGAFATGVISLTPLAGQKVYDLVFDVVSPGNAPGAVNGTADFKNIELK